MADGKMTREEIKEFIFDIFVEIIEATGATAALPPTEIAPLADETVSRMRGCMRELEREGVLESFKDDDEEFYQLTEDVLDNLLEEMQADGWTPPDLDAPPAS
jgi:predicted transcriptional regulator